MAKFEVTFIRDPSTPREPEEVDAYRFTDNPPFVDFVNQRGVFLVRYRAEDIRKITRKA